MYAYQINTFMMKFVYHNIVIIFLDDVCASLFYLKKNIYIPYCLKIIINIVMTL